MLVVCNGAVYTPDQLIPDGVVVVEGERIVALGRRGEVHIPPYAQHIDAGGGYIAPGLINMHIHGACGYSALDGAVGSLHALSRLLPEHGVTAWLPTTGSGSLDSIRNAVSAATEAMRTQQDGADILGINLEGPFISREQKGAYADDIILTPTPDAVSTYTANLAPVRLCTLAPELPGALDLIRLLREHGVVVAAGHSIATDEEMERAVAAGLSHATHLFCNMGTLRRVNLRRVAGLVESVLLDDRITAEIITDGYHLAPSLLRLAYKTKGPERLAIITDGSEMTGRAPGRYNIGGRDIVVEESITYLADRTAYAGSVATMDHCLRYAVTAMGLSLRDALRMAATTPAAILGIANRKGSLEISKDADIVVFSEHYDIVLTMVRGQIAYRRRPVTNGGGSTGG